MRGENRIREIVREEIQRAFKQSGLTLKEDAPKRGSRVRTVHGTGVVQTVRSSTVQVKLDSGAVMKVHRDRAHVIG